MEQILSTSEANDKSTDPRTPTKPKHMNQEENCKRYVIIKLFKVNDKEKILNASRENRYIHTADLHVCLTN